VNTLQAAAEEERKTSLQVLEALVDSMKLPGTTEAAAPPRAPPVLHAPTAPPSLPPAQPPALRAPPPVPHMPSAPAASGRSEALEYAESLWQYARWAQQGTDSASQDASQLVLSQPPPPQQQQ
jgi:hypothetical protein